MHMKKHYWLKTAATASVLLLGLLPVCGQRVVNKKDLNPQPFTGQNPTLGDFCITDRLSQTLRHTLGTEELFRESYQNSLNSILSGEVVVDKATKVLPTVVHVIYGNTTENVSDAKINAFLTAINSAFKGQNSQTGVRSQFQGVIGNPDIEFCLATVDPNGNPTTGIVRKSTTLSYFDVDEPNTATAPIKRLPDGSPTWDPSKYVNIWIVDIGWQSGGSSGTAGYAYLADDILSWPSTYRYLDGLVVDVHATFGTPPSYSIGIHELGHYLGLPHPFPDQGSSCTDADGFTDTPATNSYTQTGQACSATITKCGNTVQTENFMDYQIHCHQMFTLQQSAKINQVLNATNGIRKGLNWAGCAASTPTMPVANFTGCSGSSVASGTTISFTNTSTNAPTSYAWSITPATGWAYAGGTSASSANPQVTFNTAGTYTVALTATNSAGSNTKTTTGCVVVSSGSSQPVANFTGCGTYTANSTVTFTNTSTNSPTSYAWNITPATGWSYIGGTSSSSANPQVIFTSAGSYTVALTATNAQGNNTKTTPGCVVIQTAGSCNNLTATLSMGFETSDDFVGSGWKVENTNGDEDSQGNDNTWLAVPASTLASATNISIAARSGQNVAVYIYNEDETTGANDWIFTPCLSLQAGQTYRVSFWYRAAHTNWSEKMKVSIGSTQNAAGMTQTIVDLGAKNNTNWTEQVSTFSVATSGNYYIGFQCYSDADKYFLALDDINISKSGPVSVSESELGNNIGLYPNPTDGYATLRIENAAQYSNLEVTVFNAVGKQVYKKSAAIPSELNLDMTAFGSGIYFVEVRSAEAVVTKRLVVNNQ